MTSDQSQVINVCTLSLLISKPEHLIAKTYQFWLVSGWKVTNFIFKAIKVGNSENADRWKVAVTSLSLHF